MKSNGKKEGGKKNDVLRYSQYNFFCGGKNLAI